MNIILHYAVLLSDYNKINSQRHYTYDNILLDIKKNHNNGIEHQNKRQWDCGTKANRKHSYINCFNQINNFWELSSIND